MTSHNDQQNIFNRHFNRLNDEYFKYLQFLPKNQRISELSGHTVRDDSCVFDSTQLSFDKRLIEPLVLAKRQKDLIERQNSLRVSEKTFSQTNHHLFRALNESKAQNTFTNNDVIAQQRLSMQPIKVRPLHPQPIRPLQLDTSVGVNVNERQFRQHYSQHVNRQHVSANSQHQRQNDAVVSCVRTTPNDRIRPLNTSNVRQMATLTPLNTPLMRPIAKPVIVMNDRFVQNDAVVRQVTAHHNKSERMVPQMAPLIPHRQMPATTPTLNERNVCRMSRVNDGVVRQMLQRNEFFIPPKLWRPSVIENTNQWMEKSLSERKAKESMVVCDDRHCSQQSIQSIIDFTNLEKLRKFRINSSLKRKVTEPEVKFVENKIQKIDEKNGEIFDEIFEQNLRQILFKIKNNSKEFQRNEKIEEKKEKNVLKEKIDKKMLKNVSKNHSIVEKMFFAKVLDLISARDLKRKPRAYLNAKFPMHAISRAIYAGIDSKRAVLEFTRSCRPRPEREVLSGKRRLLWRRVVTSDDVTTDVSCDSLMSEEKEWSRVLSEMDFCSPLSQRLIACKKHFQYKSC